jgi:hypothetical protein
MKNVSPKIAAFMFMIFALSFAGLAGCGYTTRSMICDEYKTIRVEQFINKIDITTDSLAANKYRIYRPMLESSLTQAVIDRYLFDGNLKPATAESADLVLKGELVEFERAPLKYTADDEVQEYRINLAVNISLRDTKADKLLWEEKLFTGDATYYTTGPLAKSEDEAISLAITDLSRRIVERTVDQW